MMTRSATQPQSSLLLALPTATLEGPAATLGALAPTLMASPLALAATLMASHLGQGLDNCLGGCHQGYCQGRGGCHQGCCQGQGGCHQGCCQAMALAMALAMTVRLSCSQNRLRSVTHGRLAQMLARRAERFQPQNWVSNTNSVCTVFQLLDQTESDRFLPVKRYTVLRVSTQPKLPPLYPVRHHHI